MISHRVCGGRLPLKALSVAAGLWVLFDFSVVADDSEFVVTNQGQVVKKEKKVRHTGTNGSFGTLGYGAPGLYPGFQGFGLGYHLGYGYGGDALGVGAEGGYPFYGGPGYPHPAPTLRRIGGINPFPDYMGPGYPTPDHPNYYGGVGSLIPEQGVVTVVNEVGEPLNASDYGSATGSVPNAEALFAPFTARAAAGAMSITGGSSSYSTAVPTIPSPSPGPGPSAPSAPPVTGTPSAFSASGHPLGIDADPVVDANAVRAMKVSRVDPGSAAAKAGLSVGDLIYSINGYLTQVRGNVEWIIGHAAPSKVLTMSVRTASDGTVRSVTAQLP